MAKEEMPFDIRGNFGKTTRWTDTSAKQPCNERHLHLLLDIEEPGDLSSALIFRFTASEYASTCIDVTSRNRGAVMDDTTATSFAYSANAIPPLPSQHSRAILPS